MARELNLEVILAMADRFSGPARRVSMASKATSKAVKSAREQTRGLQSQMGEVRKLKRMEQALGSNGQALDDARRKLSGLAEEQKRTGGTSKTLSRRFDAAQRQVSKLAAKQRGLKGDAAGVRRELRDQGVDTRKLGDAERRLGDRINKVNKRLATQKKWLGRVGKASEVASGMLRRTFGVMKWGAGAAAAAGAAMVPFIRTAAQFEKYQATLETGEGSEAKAKKAMDWVSEFATTTPYQLDNVTQAYVKLRAYGLEPTGGLLRTLGDTSAGMGKDIMSSVEAIADAITGENERLKEFGIKASKSGGKINYSYTDKEGVQRQMEVMANDRKAIEKALREIWDEKFAGGMERQSKTMGGLWSNLMDQWTRFQQMVMKSGPFERIKQRLKEVLDRINQMAGNGKLEELAERIGAQMLRLIDGAWRAGKKIWEMGQVAFDVTGRIAGLVGGWENLAFVLIGLKILPTVMMLGKLGGVLWWVGATVLPVVGKAALVLGRALLLNPVGIVLTAIAGAAYLIYKNWDTVSGWLSTAWDALVGMAGRIWGRIREAFAGGIGGVSALLVDWSPMGLLWKGISAGLAKLGIDLPASLSGLGKASINGLIDGLFGMLAAVKATIGNIASGVVNWFKDKLGINSPSKVFAGFGGNLIEGLINGITAKWTALKTKITETAGGVVSWFKDKLGIQSPSKVFAGIGDDTMAGMAVGLDRSSREPVRKIDALNKRLRRQAAGITIAASAGMAGAAGPAAAAPGGGGPIEINITINAAPGQDAEAIGRAAARQTAAALRGQSGGALYDED
ncbi:tape measure protein [Guyparkeria sp. 1SP6A2]|nr:tape measure protein [Guyparkeria sp. 1SP6A2]